MTGHAGWLHHRPVGIPGAEQRPVGHHEVDLDRLQTSRGAAGQQLQRRVGLDGTDASTLRHLLGTLAGHHRLRMPAQGCLGTDDLDHRPEHGEVGHAVGGRSGRDAPGPHGILHPLQHGGDVELLRDPPCSSLCPSHAQPPEQGADPPVDLAPVLEGQDARRLDHDLGVPLGTRARVERVHGERHLVDECAGHTDEPVTEGGGLVAREGDLRGDGAHGILRATHLA